MAWMLVPRGRAASVELDLPPEPRGEAVLALTVMGLGAGCNLELALRDTGGAEIWRRVAERPAARLRTATWRDLAISLLRRTAAGLLLEHAVRRWARSPIGPMFYEIPPDRLPAGGKVRLSLRRRLPPPVLLVRATLATTPADPAERLPNDAPLQAYVGRTAATVGDVVELRVHAPARRFDAAVVRYGAREHSVLNAHGLTGAPQTCPRAAYLGAGWPVAWSFTVDGWEPGLYGIRVKDPAGGAATIPLVVRPAVPRAPLLVLVSTNTWAAYNEWGGASTYYWRKGHALGRDHACRVGRLRPNPAADPDRGEGHLARSVVELVRWLEAAGRAYDLATDDDAHGDPSIFTRYRCVMTDAHAEYWTAEMRGGIERFLARGGALAYLAGNGLYWKARADADAITVVKPWGAFDDGDAGGLWADLGQPETAITGVAYTATGANTHAPFRVLRPDHWIFAGTGVSTGSTFGGKGAFGAASGHETDKTNRHTPKGAVLLARGINSRRGGAHMIYMDRPAGGRVFSAGSITFIGALAQDPVADRIVRNVLDRFVAESSQATACADGHPMALPRTRMPSIEPHRLQVRMAAVACVVLCLLPAPARSATELYVSPTGSDANDGTQEAPFRTILAASQHAMAGTTVHVAPGTYAGGFITKASGTAAAHIRYVSDVPWAARIVGGGTAAAEMGWWNRGDYVDVKGFEIDGSGSRATSWRIGFYGTGSHGTFQGNKVHDILTDPTAFAAAQASGNGGAGAEMDGYYGSVQGSLIGNVVYNIGPPGQTSSLVHGIYQTETGTVADNLVYDVVGVGITLWHGARHINIVNNTIDHARDGGIFVGSGEEGSSPTSGDYVVVANNIVTNSSLGIYEGGITGVHNTYVDNLFWRNTGANVRLQNGLEDVGTVVADPMFAAPLRHDYRLEPGSPAIGRGSSVRAPRRQHRRPRAAGGRRSRVAALPGGKKPSGSQPDVRDG